MLREMQREVNTGHPFERRLHIDYSTNNNQPPHLHAATELRRCLMAFLSWEEASRAQNHENTLDQYCNGSVRQFA